jgi:hypothetical protein
VASIDVGGFNANVLLLTFGAGHALSQSPFPANFNIDVSFAASWWTAVRAIPCLRAAGGDRNKDYNIDFMVDCRPRDSLSEGRGW